MTTNYNHNEKQTKTQKQMIREYLESGKSLTPLQALNRMRCFRLSARISELRDEGMDIKSRWYTAWDKKKVKEYYMDVINEMTNE